MFRSSRFATRRAFTLVELLVVIAVISILAALLLPALKKAKDRAWAAVCLSNLHQIYLPTALYAADFRGLPPMWNDFSFQSCCLVRGSADWGTQFTGAGLLYKEGYLGPTTDVGQSGNVSEFYCPKYMSDISTRKSLFTANGWSWFYEPLMWGRQGWNIDGWKPHGRINITYAYRYAVGPGSDLNFTYHGIWYNFWHTGVPQSPVPRLEDTGDFLALYHNELDFYYKPFQQPVHGQGENVLFTDGHAKWVGADLNWYAQWNWGAWAKLDGK